MGLLVREVEDLVEQLLLGLLHDPRLAGLRDDQANVLLRVCNDAGGRGLDAEELGERIRRELEEPDKGIRDEKDALDGEGHPERGLLVLRERNGLGDELAERDMEVGDEGEGEDESDALRERLVKPVLDERLAHGAERDRERRDAELDGADEPHRAVHDAKRYARAELAGVRELHQARALGGHERVLGRDEERVPQHEQENGDDLQEDGHAPLSGARVLGGWSSSKRTLSIGEDSARLLTANTPHPGGERIPPATRGERNQERRTRMSQD